MKYKFEYIWLDGYQPEPNLRSKTKVIETTGEKNEWDANELPIWFFDGSSTQQAEGSFSDCALKPVRVIADPERLNAFLVMCEVLKPDGTTPHETNTRALIPDNSDDFWFGFEQEYILVDESTRRPLGFPKGGYPAPQGMYYCGVGHQVVVGRNIVEEHFDACLAAGLNITGINAEVMLGQWEFQVLGKGAKQAGDDLWLARYLLFRKTEEFGVFVEFHPNLWNRGG